jgi:ribosomal-protein-alanine N-acetyltransferase
MSKVVHSEAGSGGREKHGPPPGLAVRAATVHDLEQIVEIEQRSFSDPWSRQSFRALFDDPRVFFVVASGVDGLILGYVAAWFVAGEGEVATLAVAPRARRLGVGSLLLDSAIDAAKGRGVAAVYLEVRASNSAAKQLYASRGFREIGIRRNYYRRPTEDACVLRLALPCVM